MTEEELIDFFNQYEEELWLLTEWVYFCRGKGFKVRLMENMQKYFEDKIPYYRVSKNILDNPNSKIIAEGLKQFKIQYKKEIKNGIRNI